MPVTPENRTPPQATTYNKYSAVAGEARDTHSAGVAQPGHRTVADILREIQPEECYISNQDRAPMFYHCTKDAARILQKAPVTIRKECLNRHIGTRRAGKGPYWLTDQDVLKLQAIFQEKSEARREGAPPATLEAVFFQRLHAAEQILQGMQHDRQRIASLLYEFSNHWGYTLDSLQDEMRLLKRQMKAVEQDEILLKGRLKAVEQKAGIDGEGTG